MYNKIKILGPDTVLYEQDGFFFTFRKILPDDIELYRMLTAISNSHLASVRELVTDENGDIYAVTEYIQGSTLADLLESGTIFTEEDAVKICMGICEGLSELHRKEIIHRDINPNNIIIDRMGNSVIIDYGISRMEKVGAVSDTEILGTRGYTAPEQFGFMQTTPASDVYSVGVLLKLLLSADKTHTISEKYKSVIEKCLSFSPEKRYKNASELLDALNGQNKKRKAVSVISAITQIFVGLIYLAVFALITVIWWMYIDDSFTLGSAVSITGTLIFAFCIPPILFFLGFSHSSPIYHRFSDKIRHLCAVLLSILSLVIAFTLFIAIP